MKLLKYDPTLLARLRRTMIQLNIAGLVLLALLAYQHWTAGFALTVVLLVVYNLMWWWVVTMYRRYGWDKPPEK